LCHRPKLTLGHADTAVIKWLAAGASGRRLKGRSGRLLTTGKALADELVLSHTWLS